MSHTQEPWRLGRWRQNGKIVEPVGPHQAVVDTDIGPMVLMEGNQNFYDQAVNDIRRAVVCVNALAGISTEQLEAWLAVQPTGAATARIVAADQTSKTLEALLQLVAMHEAGQKPDADTSRSVVEQARDILGRNGAEVSPAGER